MITIDEVVEWCLQPGVKLDFRHFDDGYVVTAEDVAAEFERIGHELAPLDSPGQHRRQPLWPSDYVAAGCGMGREATLYLLERGVRLTGTDGWSLMRRSSTPRTAMPRPGIPRRSGKC